jgi:hypothetical protein
VSESTEGSETGVGLEFQVDGRFPITSIRRPVQPPGAVFALGWLMAELFDPRRRVSVSQRQPPFSTAVQLPQVPDLAPDPKLVFLASELTEIMRWFPGLGQPLSRVTEQTDKVRALVVAETAAQIAAAEQSAAQAGLASKPVAPVQAGGPGQFSQGAFLAAVSGLNQAILDLFADDPERLNAYQLGLALSDLVWLPYIPEPGRNPDPDAARPSALLGQFARPQMAALKTLISGSGPQLPASAGAVVSRSLDHWADWLDVNTSNIQLSGTNNWSPKAPTVLRALRVQGWVWRAVLIADPEVTVSPSMSAWVQAATAIAQATQKVALVILRRFWWAVAILLAVLGGLLYLVISNLSGAGEVWASLVTVAAVVGAGGAGLGSGVSGAMGGVGFEVWSAAKMDAEAWGVTWLPALVPTTREKSKMSSRGVPAQQIRKNLDVS